MDTLMGGLGSSSGGGLLGALSSKRGLDVLQAGTTGIGIMQKLAQGDATAGSYDAKAAEYEVASQAAGVEAQGRADTSEISASGTIESMLQKAFADATGAKLTGQTSAVRGGSQGYVQGLSDVLAGLQRGTGFDIQAGQTEAQAGAGFAYNAGQEASLKRQLMTRLGSITAQSGASGFDAPVGQAVGGRVTQAAKDTSDVAMAQTMMRYGAGLASADVLRAQGVQARAQGQTQSDLVNQVASISGQRDITEGDISADLSKSTADIATPVAQLQGDWGAKLALASGKVAQMQDQASMMNAIMAGKQAQSQARAGALTAGLGGLFSIFARGI